MGSDSVKIRIELENQSAKSFEKLNEIIEKAERNTE